MSLEALKDTSNALKKIPYWIIGGYALDIAVGRVTREHANADVLVKLTDIGKARTALEEHDYVTEQVHDKITATKEKKKINLLTMDEDKQDYTIRILNAIIKIPKELMTRTKGTLEGTEYTRIPNELIKILNQYSLKEQDALIARNLQTNKNNIKKIKIKITTKY